MYTVLTSHTGAAHLTRLDESFLTIIVKSINTETPRYVVSLALLLLHLS